MRDAPLAAVLSFGLLSYCLVLFVSMDAPIGSLLLMGALSILMISASLMLLWRTENTSASESRMPASVLNECVITDNQEQTSQSQE
jgi:hypothetical protein